MRSPLLYLFVTTKRNALRRFLGGLRRPRRLAGVLGTVALAGFVMWSLTRTQGSEEAARASAAPMLRAYLGFVLIMSFLSGFAERGIPFTPSEVDFLFPGPFARRHLVLHHLAGALPAIVFGALLPFFFFGRATPRPGFAFLGCVLASLVAQHLRLFTSIATIHLGEKAFARVKGPARLVLLALTLGFILLLVTALSKDGGARETIGRFVTSDLARILLYPAAAAGDLATAPSVSALGPPLLGLLLAVALTLGAVLALQVNFLEESLGVSARHAARRTRLKQNRNVAAATAEDRRVRTVRLPALRAFEGAGAVAWKNLLVARRSLRSVLFSTLFLAVFFVPAVAGKDGSHTLPLVMVGLFPLFLSASLVFDFRGEGAQMARLRALPVSRGALAAAEIAVPTGIILLYQGVYLGVMAALGRLALPWAALAWVGCIPLTATMIAATNLAWLWMPTGVGGSLLQVLFLGADAAVLATIGSLLHAMGAGPRLLVPALALTQVGLLVLTGALLARAFDRRDVAEEGA